MGSRLHQTHDPLLAQLAAGVPQKWASLRSFVYPAAVSVLARARDHLRRVETYVHGDLWSHDYFSRQASPRQLLVLFLRSVYIVWTGFSRERLRLRAAALTYTTILSLVPAMAVIFSVFTAFGGLEDARDRLKRQLAEFLSVGHQEKILDFLDQFVGSASAIGGIGVVFLLATSLSLLTNIEKAFNDIWGLKQDRSFLRRFQSYWPLLTLGPLLLGVSLTVTASVQKHEVVQGLAEFIPGGRFVLTLLPVVLTWVGFTLAYLIMPNTRVGVRHALIGGVVAGTIWEIAKRLYAIYATQAISYSTIYGSLSVVPLSVIWIYVSWLVALIGATIAFAAQNASTYEPEQDRVRLCQHYLERLAAWLLVLVHEHFEAGRGAMPLDAILHRVPGPPRELRRILERLVEGGLFTQTTVEDERAYLPGRPAHSTTLADLVRLMRDDGEGAAGAEEPGVLAGDAFAQLETANDEAYRRLGSESLTQLLARARVGAPAADAEGTLGPRGSPDPEGLGA